MVLGCVLCGGVCVCCVSVCVSVCVWRERETSASVLREEGMKRCWWLEVEIVENVFSGQQLEKVGESVTS